MKIRNLTVLLVLLIFLGCTKDENPLEATSMPSKTDDPLSMRISEIKFTKSQNSSQLIRTLIFENDSLARSNYSKVILKTEDNKTIVFETQYNNSELIALNNLTESNSDILFSYTYDTNLGRRLLTNIKSFCNIYPYELNLIYNKGNLEKIDIKHLDPLAKFHQSPMGPWTTDFCLGANEDTCQSAFTASYQTTHYINPFYNSNQWLINLVALNYNTKTVNSDGELKFNPDGFTWSFPLFTKKNLPMSNLKENYKYSYDISFQNKNRLNAINYTPIGLNETNNAVYSVDFKYKY